MSRSSRHWACSITESCPSTILVCGRTGRPTSPCAASTGSPCRSCWNAWPTETPRRWKYGLYPSWWGSCKGSAKRSPSPMITAFCTVISNRRTSWWAVVDWGLAIGLKSTLTLDTPVSADPDATQSERFVSMDGRVAGTPLYMAPEQARGDRSAFGPHTDIYALGGLLFSVLTLDPPVRGRGEKVLERVKRGEVTPLHRYKNPNLQHCPNQRIPSSLAAIAKKALSFKPEDRYQDVGSLLKDLEDTQSGFAPEAEQAGFLKRASLFVNRNKAACVIGALLGVLLTLALILWSLTSFALWQNAPVEELRDGKGRSQTLARVRHGARCGPRTPGLPRNARRVL